MVYLDSGSETPTRRPPAAAVFTATASPRAGSLVHDDRSDAMSPPVHDGSELIPRPEKTPAAIKAALAVVAVDRLAEMADGQTRAMAEAISTGSIGPLQSFVVHWAAVVEIERRPETARGRRRRADSSGQEHLRYVAKQKDKRDSPADLRL